MSARDDKKRAQKSDVSQRRRLAARKQKRRSRRYRRFINPSLRLVESFGSASAVAATPKANFGTFSRSSGRTHFQSTITMIAVKNEKRRQSNEKKKLVARTTKEALRLYEPIAIHTSLHKHIQ